MLLKTTTCYGRFCTPGVNRESAFAWLGQALSPRSLPPPAENDCGVWCSAFALAHEDIPFTHFSHSGYRSGLTLVYDATPALWGGHVRCLATTHSFSSMLLVLCMLRSPLLHVRAAALLAQLRLGRFGLLRRASCRRCGRHDMPSAGGRVRRELARHRWRRKPRRRRRQRRLAEWGLGRAELRQADDRVGALPPMPRPMHAAAGVP